VDCITAPINFLSSTLVIAGQELSTTHRTAFRPGPPFTDRDQVDAVPRRISAPCGHHPAL